MRSVPSMSTLAALTAVLACGGGKSTEPSPPRAPTQTAVGTPTGPLVSQTIGTAGGTVASADGVLSVTIPAGALAGDATIGVQAISPQSPGATGTGYRLTPEGTTFAQAVTLVFNYDDADVNGSAPELLWIASQQADRSWLLAMGVTLDPVAQTLTVQTTHFSDWTRLQGLQIRPPEGRLKPGESLNLTVKNCTTIVDASTGNQSAYAIDCEDAPTSPTPPGEDELPPLPTFAVDPGSWAVNGIRGGSTTYGFVAGDKVAQYVAPSRAPTGQNPVAVSVRARTYQDRQEVQLVANIEIELVCGPAAPTSAARAFRADDVCSADWIGNTSTVFWDDNPLYRLETQVRWKYDTAQSARAGVGISMYYPEGMSKVTSIDPCITLSPDTRTWVNGDISAGGYLRIDYNQTVPTYIGSGGNGWQATATDICDPSITPQVVPVGGAWFAANGTAAIGTLETPGLSRITGTNSAGGQTFTFTFDRVGSTPPGVIVGSTRR